MADSSLYRDSFEFHPDALAVSVQGSVCAVNAQTESLFGYPRGELIGRQIRVLLPRATEPGVCRCKDGSTFPAEIATQQLPDSRLLTTAPPFPVAGPGDFVRISIADTGCGMTREVRAHLFEPFFTTKPAGAGTGFGLATAYGIVQQAGGFILVESEPGKGTTVHVCLPMAKEAKVESPALKIAPADHRGGETILLVEDDEQVRSIACVLLEENGYRVLQSASGPAALSLATEYGAPIHLLLSDVVMPEMSGTELAGRIVSVRPDIKVLLMSGYNEDERANRALRSSNLLQKPFTEQDLVGRIRETLDRQQAKR